MAKINKLKIEQIIFIALVLRIIILIISGYHPDLLNHIDWGNKLLSLGPKKFYENIFWDVSWPNQPFGTMILFALCAFLKNIIFEFIELINQNVGIFPSFIIPFISKNIHIWMVKLPFIIFDLGLGFLIYKIVLSFKPKQAKLASILFLFNPVIIYNSTIWGQTDSLINFSALFGIYLAFQRKYFSGIIIFLTTFLFKLSLIIYLPVSFIFLIKRYKDWKKFIPPVLVFFIIIIFMAVPFKLEGFSSLEWIWYMYTNRVLVRQGSMLNGNAFNFWGLIFSINLSNSEFSKFLGITYQYWGRLLYLISLLPIWIKFLKNKLSLKNLLNILLLSSFSCFLFLTNMHERYLYPIFPLITILIFFKKTKINIKHLALLSSLHFLNLYKLWYYPSIKILVTILDFANSIVCRLFSLILLLIFVKYYFKYLKSED